MTCDLWPVTCDLQKKPAAAQTLRYLWKVDDIALSDGWAQFVEFLARYFSHEVWETIVCPFL